MHLCLERSGFIPGQRGPAEAQVTTVNRQERGGGGNAVGLHALHDQPDVHVWLGFPFLVGQSGQCRGFERKREIGEKETMSAPNYKKRWKKRRNLKALDFCLHSDLRPSYTLVATDTQSSHPDDKGGKKKEKWKKYKNIVHQVKLIEKLQKAIMILRMCRPFLLAASKHRKSCSSLCLHCVDPSMPSGPGWALHALSTVDIHTHGG